MNNTLSVWISFDNLHSILYTIPLYKSQTTITVKSYLPPVESGRFLPDQVNKAAAYVRYRKCYSVIN